MWHPLIEIPMIPTPIFNWLVQPLLPVSHFMHFPQNYSKKLATFTFGTIFVNPIQTVGLNLLTEKVLCDGEPMEIFCKMDDCPVGSGRGVCLIG